jgi:hypothetical protein
MFAKSAKQNIRIIIHHYNIYILSLHTSRIRNYLWNVSLSSCCCLSFFILSQNVSIIFKFELYKTSIYRNLYTSGRIIHTHIITVTAIVIIRPLYVAIYVQRSSPYVADKLYQNESTTFMVISYLLAYKIIVHMWELVALTFSKSVSKILYVCLLICICAERAPNTVL